MSTFSKNNAMNSIMEVMRCLSFTTQHNHNTQHNTARSGTCS